MPSESARNPLQKGAFCTSLGIRFCSSLMRKSRARDLRIYLGDSYVGDVYAYDDTFRAGARVFEIHLDEDWRGPRRVHDRSLVRKTAQRMVDTLPWR